MSIARKPPQPNPVEFTPLCTDPADAAIRHENTIANPY